MRSKNEIIPKHIVINNVIWSKVEGYVNTYVNENGDVRLLNSNGELVTTKVFEWKTTKGTYLYAKVISDSFNIVNKAIHQLVCVTYHGLPPNDGYIYEPNHIDGDKHNNRPDNLEWATRSKNAQHAVDNGLCSYGIRIKATNIEDGTVLSFNSMSSCCRYFNTSRYDFKDSLLKSRDGLYLSKWEIEIDNSSDKNIVRKQNRTIVCKDYINDTVSVYDTADEASEQTKVNSSSILFRVKMDRNSDTYNKLLSRYIFRDVSDCDNWPDYTYEQAIESEKKYIAHNLKCRR